MTKRTAQRRGQEIIDRVFSDVRRSTQLAMQVTAVESIKGRNGTRMARVSMKHTGTPVDPALLPALDAFEWYADRAGRPTGRGFPCLWSGEKTIRPEARFIPGYDAKLKAQLARIFDGRSTLDSISPEARWFLATDEVCGYHIQDNELRRGRRPRAA